MKSTFASSVLLLAGYSKGAFGASILSRQASTEPTVQISNGTIQGYYNETFAQDYFLGVPYSLPPTGSLRFELPQPINTTWTTTLDATTTQPHCTYYLLFPGSNPAFDFGQSEDCLKLNVVRPAGTTSDSRLPVVVWIHGGGFTEGGIADEQYTEAFILRNSVEMGMPTIMVRIAYRLNGWGFLAGDDVQAAGKLNVGLHDQRLALAWVQENIGAFGGDHSRVTIMGESAGAASVGLHLLANGGRDDGLFQAAIAQSGGPFHYATFDSSAESQVKYAAVLAASNCTGSVNTLDCLRATPFETLDAIFLETSWSPVIDGSLIADFPSITLSNNQFVKVPLLIGSNTDEGKLFAGTGVNSTEGFATYIQEEARFLRVGTAETTNLLADAYPDSRLSSSPGASDDSIILPAPYLPQFARLARYMGDSMIVAGRRYACELWTSSGISTYSYRFNTISAGVDPLALGATHFVEIPFVFDNVEGAGMVLSAFSVEPADRAERYRALGHLVSRMWVSFINTQSPNNHGITDFNLTWPAYDINTPQNIVFDGNTTSFIEADDYRVDAMRIFIDRALDFAR